MRKKSLFLLTVLILVLCACGGGNGSGGTAPLPASRTPELLAAVPSDALVVMCYNHCSEGMALYDSTSVLQKLDLTAFKKAPMALALCYSGSLMPILALDAGRADADSASAVHSLLEQAASLKLKAGYIRPDPEAKRRGFVVITPSSALYQSVQRHLTEYTSILDAPRFPQALKTAASEEFIAFRGSGAERMIPKGWLKDFFPRKELTAFLDALADWIMLVPEKGGFNVLPCYSNDDTYFTNILASVPLSDSRLGPLLPSGTRLALTLPVRHQQLRQAVDRWQDASMRLTRHRNELSELGRQAGKDPLKWEQEVDVCEVALVHFDGEAVTLVRPARNVTDREMGENPWRGFLPALYGKAFALADDSYTAIWNGWHIYGSAAAVQAFLEAERPEEGAGSDWPGKSCRLLIRESDKTLAWDKNGIKLTWNSNQ